MGDFLLSATDNKSPQPSIDRNTGAKVLEMKKMTLVRRFDDGFSIIIIPHL